ncbi:MAG: hypothetical protein M3430_15710 [Acidobacteriota bacterium]|nr:hypothetical protein [Acidobacteriota bacterium]
MSTIVASRELSTTANIIAGGLTIPLPQITQPVVLQIAIRDFQIHLEMPLEGVVSNMSAGKVLLRATVDKEVAVILTIAGNLVEDEFQIEGVYFNTEAPFESARASFVASTLHALFSLSKGVNLRIPELEINLDLEFSRPLLDISQMLRRRQLEYRIMLIERATGYEFMLPSDLTEEQVHHVTLIYRAIVDRTFMWPVNSVTIYFPATDEWVNRLIELDRHASFTPGLDPLPMMLFGQKISLGNKTLTIEDKIIKDYDKVQKELARNDGHNVAIVIRSLSGQGRYEFLNAPRLPDFPWEPTIQMLVDLESHLDSHLVERYHALAAATLSGLTEEEKVEVTTRPEFGEAFLIADSEEEPA